MSDNISKAVINALTPKGAAWAPVPGGQLDLLYDGIAENHERVREFLEGLAEVRDPNKTILLADLEREYGFLLDSALSETERRERLAALVYAKRGTGTKDYLQDRLHEAGFTQLFVYDNDPAVDPDQFIISRSSIYCDSPTAVCGHEDAFCADYAGGEYVVNGDIYTQSVDFLTVCGGDIAVCGNENAIAGRFVDSKILVTYYAPDGAPIPSGWNMIFFVGGAVTRDGTGAIIDIEQPLIYEAQRADIVKIILRHKPLGTWAALSVHFFPSEIWEDTLTGEDIEDTLTGDTVEDANE